MNINKEAVLHLQIVKWLKIQWPKIIFRTDFSSGVKMSINQAVRHKSLQMCRAYPDLFLACPMNGKAGLFIELKTDISEVYKKDMTFKKCPHIAEQAAMIERLRELNYAAFFGIGFTNTVRIINDYLK